LPLTFCPDGIIDVDEMDYDEKEHEDKGNVPDEAKDQILLLAFDILADYAHDYPLSPKFSPISVFNFEKLESQ